MCMVVNFTIFHAEKSFIYTYLARHGRNALVQTVHTFL